MCPDPTSSPLGNELTVPLMKVQYKGISYFQLSAQNPERAVFGGGSALFS